MVLAARPQLPAEPALKISDPWARVYPGSGQGWGQGRQRGPELGFPGPGYLRTRVCVASVWIKEAYRAGWARTGFPQPP